MLAVAVQTAPVKFQHTAARRRLLFQPLCRHNLLCCFNTQPPEGGCIKFCFASSSLKCFNTQPPEGGCRLSNDNGVIYIMFQHTAARRRLLINGGAIKIGSLFQHTAARRRLHRSSRCKFVYWWFQHTAARRRLHAFIDLDHTDKHVSTHSRPKAAANSASRPIKLTAVSTHSRPKAAARV